MCGRFAVTLPPEAMRRFFRYAEQPNFPPRYNIAPTQPVPILRKLASAKGPSRHLTLMRWGFLPGFVKDPKTFPLMINARCETLLVKASFRAAAKRRRCLFIADAFYEWRDLGKSPRKAAKPPYLFRRRDGAPLAFAGLWETWIGPNGEELDTATIITTGANGATSAIHERLPAILEPDSFDLWLDPDESVTDSALSLLHPPGNDVLEFFEIGPAVNKVDCDEPEIQTPVGESARIAPALSEPVQGRLF